MQSIQTPFLILTVKGSFPHRTYQPVRSHCRNHARAQARCFDVSSPWGNLNRNENNCKHSAIGGPDRAFIAPSGPAYTGDQHIGRHGKQHAGECALEPRHGQTMRRTRAEGCRQHAEGSHQRQPWRPDETHRVGRAPGGVETAEDESADVRQRDRESQRGGGGDGTVHGHVAPGKERDADKAAAHPDQARQCADRASGSEQPGCPGQAASRRWLAPAKHLHRGKQHEHTEHHSQHVALEQGEDAQTANEAAGHNARGQPAHDLPVHGATAMMRAHAREGGKQDYRHRCGDRHLYRQAGGQFLPLQEECEDGHQHDASPDAEQSGEKATRDAKRG